MKHWLDVIKEERESREKLKPDDLCTYGVACLDDPLKVIMPNDLILIGADSGAGKSEIALQIAIHNARRGKHIAFYYFEGGESEAVARLKWQYICELYYAEYFHENIDMDFSLWRANMLDKKDVIAEIENRVQDEFLKIKGLIFFYEINEGLKIEAVLGSLMEFHSLENAIRGGFYGEGNKLMIDLIIIDHLQYFELSGGKTEIEETTQILKEVKKITNVFNTPIILISHLRKKDRERGLPDQEDFYGSSNAPKISTVAIMISNVYLTDFSGHLYPTFFRIVKSRQGIKPYYAMRTNFDIKRREYEKEYQVYPVNNLGKTTADPLPSDKLPKWAKQKEGG